MICWFVRHDAAVLQRPKLRIHSGESPPVLPIPSPSAVGHLSPHLDPKDVPSSSESPVIHFEDDGQGLDELSQNEWTWNDSEF
jgi:hypothetical protein